MTRLVYCPGVCRECGCYDEHPCPGGCFWVEEDLCSQCLKSPDAFEVDELDYPGEERDL